MRQELEQMIKEQREFIGGRRVLLGLSGGVDSSVVAALLSRAVGANLICIFVDTGLMRKNEGDEVEAAFSDRELTFIRVDAEKRFLDKLAGVSDPEAKRKIVGEEFVRVFEDEARKLGDVELLAQGTIYPDIAESKNDKGVLVKSHHNVGGLPENIGFDGLVEPLKSLYKDDVRALGRELGLPPSLTERQPFPGPGLSIRVIGEVTKQKLDTLREADYIFRSELESSGYSKEVSQYFAVLTSMRSVGVTNNERTYDYTLALRAIKTSDFMVAQFARIPYEILEAASGEILANVKGINRIVYDITNKPPATVEWE